MPTPGPGAVASVAVDARRSRKGAREMLQSVGASTPTAVDVEERIDN